MTPMTKFYAQIYAQKKQMLRNTTGMSGIYRGSTPPASTKTATLHLQRVAFFFLVLQ